MTTAAPAKMKSDWLEVVHHLAVTEPPIRMVVLEAVEGDGEDEAEVEAEAEAEVEVEVEVDVLVRPVVGVVTRVFSRFRRRRPASEPRIRAVAPGRNPEDEGFTCVVSYASESTLNVLNDEGEYGVWDGVGTLEEVCGSRYEVVCCDWPPAEDGDRLAEAKARFLER